MQPVFSNRDVARLDEAPISDEASLYTLQIDGRPMLMAGAIEPFNVEGRTYKLMLGIFVDENYISNINALKSFEIRLYYRQGEQLSEYYSSREGRKLQRPLRENVAKALEGGAPYVFQGASDGGHIVGVYTPLTGGSGPLLGVIFCGLRTDVGLAGWVNRTNIFVAILLLGSLLAVLVGGRRLPAVYPPADAARGGCPCRGARRLSAPGRCARPRRGGRAVGSL